MTEEFQKTIKNLFDGNITNRMPTEKDSNSIICMENIKIPVELQYIIEQFGGVYINEQYAIRGIEVSPLSYDGFEKINCFIGLDGKENIISIYERLKDEIPPKTIPIAEMDGGNYVLLSENGAIYAWIHDEPRGNDIFLLANDFLDFIARFELLEEQEDNSYLQTDNEYASEYPDGFWD